jgi:dTMP kinase
MQLIVIDGLDGSGKSTQAKLICKALKKQQKTICLRVHPEGDNWFGKKARAYLLLKGKNAHFASAIFYMFDVIRSVTLYSWRRVDYVLFVRYFMGTAYLPAPLHTVAYNFFSAVLPKSQHMIFLDVKPDVAAARINANRKELEMFESLASLKKVRKKALSLTRFDSWVIIDSSKPLTQVAYELKKELLTTI